MKRLNDQKAMLIFAGFVSAIVLCCKTAYADFTFGDPTNLGPTVNCPHADAGTTLSPDGLSLYFGSLRDPGYGEYDLWVTNRASICEPWCLPMNLGPVINSSANDGSPCLSADGLELYFGSYRSGMSETSDIWVTHRLSPCSPWENPVNLGLIINSNDTDWAPSLSPDGCSLYFHSDRPGGIGGYDLWVASRATPDDPWEEPVNLGEVVNSNSMDCGPSVSADNRVLVFYSSRSGGLGNLDLWITIRTNPSEPWSVPVNLGASVNTNDAEFSPTISYDGRTLWFTAYRANSLDSWDLWWAPIVPIVDLNSDGIVDATDMAIMVDHWGTENSLCDIGPMPWGDGVVDVQDLIILAEHLFEEVPLVQ